STKPGEAPHGGLGRPPATAPAADTRTPPPAPTVGEADTALAASAAAVGPHIVSPPQVGDGRLWVLPRPALPGEVADALYGQEEHKDSVAAHRLRAMVDSLNVIIDQEQRARQKPTWTTEVDRKSTRLNSS